MSVAVCTVDLCEELHRLPSRFSCKHPPSRVPTSDTASSPSTCHLNSASTDVSDVAPARSSLEEMLSLLQQHRQRSIERCDAFVAEMDAAMRREERAMMAININPVPLETTRGERRLRHGSSLPASVSSTSMQWAADVNYYNAPSPARVIRPSRRHTSGTARQSPLSECLRSSHHDHDRRYYDSSPSTNRSPSAATNHTRSESCSFNSQEAMQIGA